MQRCKRTGLMCLLLAAVALGLKFFDQTSFAQGKGKGKPKEMQVEGRDKDKEAIRKATDSFAKAFEAGDAKAVAAHWTPDGEYIADDGVAYRGRTALEAVYKELFAKDKGHKVEVEVEKLRFPSKDTAVEEGYFKVRHGKGEWATSRYSVLHVREEGQWLMAIVREWPGQGLSLRDLEWLIGSWKSSRDGTDAQTTYEWDKTKKFINVRFSIKTKEGLVNGKQIIAQDPTTGLLRSWTFEDGGGFGEATWQRDGSKWVIESAGVNDDGETQSATNILSRLGDDAFTWQSTNRTVDGEEEADTVPIRVNRVLAKTE